MFWKTGGMLLTAIEGQPIPRIPSNLAAMNAIPGCFVASANNWFFTESLAICRRCAHNNDDIQITGVMRNARACGLDSTARNKKTLMQG